MAMKTESSSTTKYQRRCASTSTNTVIPIPPLWAAADSRRVGSRTMSQCINFTIADNHPNCPVIVTK
eukprot:CCRYP_019731-RA/>CCRYP_019731-RA protein AED:0.01 eAED:0.01 QI:535/1/1/1/0/0/2/2229/66